ncbi:MAG: plastocyanin [Hydrogenophaga sp.]|jgi:plastocyanin|uniref:plastocyanin n=1 Tax=Hydrogenophaga sp. TaxID=1904254 RepID=UPI002723C6DC|nr:plastocyanin [Hydrogenophaga sp.]MDO9482902.1 plastocyanin [Hydrogenophaga sp.]MDP2095318.1 plastocyanin [Hydrogenophaga sp.]MDP3346459.1 plastocyanin [Hydrogenophaga sp.]MDP3807495.1 plastocyanin [Hydrogenophaga sp.]
MTTLQKTTQALAWLVLAGAAQAATVQVTVLARDGQPLADAVVVLESAVVQAPRAPTPVQATIAQQKMQFLPAVSVLPVGSRARFTNQDGWEHHVRGRPAGLAGLNATAQQGFELRLPGKLDGQEPSSADVTLNQAGPLQLGCHLHGSMRGFVYVADTPWAVKTGPDGVAMLPDVPEGAARVRVWHPEQLLEMPATAITVVPVTLLNAPTQVVPRRRRL